jgi:hypothetical protein
MDREHHLGCLDYGDDRLAGLEVPPRDEQQGVDAGRRMGGLRTAASVAVPPGSAQRAEHVASRD